jgi:hypothetical protein
MSTYSTFHVPGIDAGVSLAIDGDRLALCLMAKGRARNKDGSYSKRNPDRRALLLHLFERMQAPGGAHFSLTHSKGGASASPWNEHQGSNGYPGVGLVDTLADMRKVYSKAGNFRVDYQFVSSLSRLDDMAEVLGLVPADGRRPPRDVRFFGGA